MVAIAFADTHLWYALKSTNNIWNVGNNDRGSVVEYDSIESWIIAIAYTLNNKYLGNKQTIGDLSFAWSCQIDCTKVYATSNQNWELNVLNTLSNIYRYNINPDFKFRK